ncbi:MAG: ABC transporter ATP-binding protein [Verrucomicrobia bacterium]|nr:ABC transporter ATP-binding protein [Verrucomicrobiota bacterium]
MNSARSKLAADTADLPDDVVLSVRNVSKKFCRNLRRSMAYGMKDLGLNLIGVKQDTTKIRKDEFLALDDVSFEVRRGECLGLIGPNGCGKTTLLRLLTGIFPPDAGEISVRGRVGALIALGAGFHPHLTGRENIYLNGTILGLHKKDLDARMDDIVGFAEIGKFIDAPVSVYSSGMRVRLGFAIAIHIEPELLLVDEVLAVGDEGFRSKCYGAISDLLAKAAVVFVSHQMPTVARICRRVMVLKDGVVAFDGDTARGIELYTDMFGDVGFETKQLGTGEATITNLHLRQGAIVDPAALRFGDSVTIAFDVQVAPQYEEFFVSISFMSRDGQLTAQLHSGYNGVALHNDGGLMHVEVHIPSLNLNPGKHAFGIIVFDSTNVRHLCWVYAARSFRVEGNFVGSAPVQLRGKWGKQMSGSEVGR